VKIPTVSSLSGETRSAREVESSRRSEEENRTLGLFKSPIGTSSPSGIQAESTSGIPRKDYIGGMRRVLYPGTLLCMTPDDVAAPCDRIGRQFGRTKCVVFVYGSKRWTVAAVA